MSVINSTSLPVPVSHTHATYWSMCFIFAQAQNWPSIIGNGRRAGVIQRRDIIDYNSLADSTDKQMKVVMCYYNSN